MTDASYSLSPRSSPDLVTCASTDDGKTWQKLGINQSYYELATDHETTYALRAEGVNGPDGPSVRVHLATSTDHMKSWQNIDQAFTAPNERTNAFWLNPHNGSLLVEDFILPGTGEINNNENHLWESGDGGQHWHEVAPTNLQTDSLAVQLPFGDEPWYICVAGQKVINPLVGDDQLSCTTNGGVSWTSRPIPSKLSKTAQLDIFMIGADGSLLADPIDPDSSAGSIDILRLPPNSTNWDSLGAWPADSGGPLPVTAGVIWWAPNAFCEIPICYAGGPQQDYTTTYP